MSDTNVTGGCLCGAIRFRATRRLTGAFICHCRMCQRASGSAFSVNALYTREGFELPQGQPTWYASSKVADRGICGTCGSQMFNRYSAPEWTGWISISLGAHDDPNAVPAERHFGMESRQAWLQIHDALPTSEYPDSFVEDVARGGSDAYAALPKNAD